MDAGLGRKAADQRQRVGDALRAMGLRMAPFQTNFIFLDTGRDSVELEGQLLMQGILIKAWREPGFQTFIGATIGRPWENDRPAGHADAVTIRLTDRSTELGGTAVTRRQNRGVQT